MTVSEASVTVAHEKGLHARPASVFVQTASQFDAEIRVGETGAEETADAKSSIAIMSLGVEQGDEITIRSDGSDAADATETLVELVESDFELEEDAGDGTAEGAEADAGDTE